MNSKKLRVAYYDFVNSWDTQGVKESTSLANWLIHKDEKDEEEEVVVAIVDVLLEEAYCPFNIFIDSVLNKRYRKIDKVIFSTIKKFGMSKVRELYEQLSKLGISLEFIKEGPVDEKLIEIYTYAEQRNLMWAVRRFELIDPIPHKEVICNIEPAHPNGTMVSHIYRMKC